MKFGLSFPPLKYLYLSKSPNDGLLPSPYRSNKYFTISPTTRNQESTQHSMDWIS